MREREGPWASLAFSFSFCRQKISAYVSRLKFEFCYFLLNARYLLRSFAILWTHHHKPQQRWWLGKATCWDVAFNRREAQFVRLKVFFTQMPILKEGMGSWDIRLCHHGVPQWLCHHGAPQGGCWQLLWQYSRHSLALASWFLFKLVRIPAALGFSWTIMFFSCVWFLLQGDDGEDIHSEASNVATWWGHPCYGLLLWDV